MLMSMIFSSTRRNVNLSNGEFDDVPFFISMERRSSMNDMVFILVIQLARLPIVMVRDVARDFLTHLNDILANFNHCEFCK